MVAVGIGHVLRSISSLGYRPVILGTRESDWADDFRLADVVEIHDEFSMTKLHVSSELRILVDEVNFGCMVWRFCAFRNGTPLTRLEAPLADTIIQQSARLTSVASVKTLTKLACSKLEEWRAQAVETQDCGAVQFCQQLNLALQP